jgi:hypothetical protein
MNTRDIARILVMTALLCANLAIGELVAGTPTLDILETVQLGAAVILCSAVYLVIGALACHRPILKPIPTMTVPNIWGLVYGLGLVVFTAVYATLGVNSFVSTAFTWALAAVACDDLVARSLQPLPRTAAFMTSLVLSLAATIAISVSDADRAMASAGIDEGQWSCIAWGIVVPVLTPVLFLTTREHRHYTTPTVLEFVQFAMPFAIILSVILLVSLHPPPRPETSSLYDLLSNYTLMTEVGARAAAQALERVRQIQQGAFLVPLAPLTALPTVFFAVQTPLLYATADFVTCMTLALAARAVWHHPESPAAPFIACAAVGSTLARGIACILDPDSEAARAFPEDPEETAFTITEFTDDAAAPMLHTQREKKGAAVPRPPPPAEP